MLFSAEWWKAAITRALRTFAQVSIPFLAKGIGAHNVDWFDFLSTAALSSLLALLMAVSGLPEVKDAFVHGKDADVVRDDECKTEEEIEKEVLIVKETGEVETSETVERIKDEGHDA